MGDRRKILWKRPQRKVDPRYTARKINRPSGVQPPGEDSNAELRSRVVRIRAPCSTALLLLEVYFWDSSFYEDFFGSQSPKMSLLSMSNLKLGTEPDSSNELLIHVPVHVK